MKLNRVLVVYKSLSDEDRATLSRHRRQHHHRHNETLDAIVRTLRHHRIPYRLLNRRKLRHGFTASLIVTIGGDGTVLSAVHVAGAIPILGVNSRPGKSVGFYCAATRATFPHILRQVLQESWKPAKLPLLEAKINGKPFPFLALNDILVASTVPSDLMSYRLRVGTQTEWQRSSGLWICAGPGTTAGYHSAGGKSAAMTSSQLRYLVREPCPFPGQRPGQRYRFARGVIPRGQTIRITGDGKGATICLDGPSLVTHLKAGDVLTVRIAHQSVFLVR
ncbi:MAG: NAD(+)/NADH kinase [Deltaproteobacteria bacterium]|nr:NAD(+)/NADH kinase [Deltaproteobacteria bacterium]